MKGNWITTKEHYFETGKNNSFCNQVMRSTKAEHIHCQVCEKALNSPAKRQLEIGGEDEEK